nr:hypothetical protein CFP56_63542 [Quercus suber]
MVQMRLGCRRTALARHVQIVRTETGVDDRTARSSAHLASVKSGLKSDDEVVVTVRNADDGRKGHWRSAIRKLGRTAPRFAHPGDQALLRNPALCFRFIKVHALPTDYALSWFSYAALRGCSHTSTPPNRAPQLLSAVPRHSSGCLVSDGGNALGEHTPYSHCSFPLFLQALEPSTDRSSFSFVIDNPDGHAQAVKGL